MKAIHYSTLLMLSPYECPHHAVGLVNAMNVLLKFDAAKTHSLRRLRKKRFYEVIID
tara:strand:- start:331 stop:501 length:171 start_codon:yes stop_codon:yes gene_type:complete